MSVRLLVSAAGKIGFLLVSFLWSNTKRDYYTTTGLTCLLLDVVCSIFHFSWTLVVVERLCFVLFLLWLYQIVKTCWKLFERKCVNRQEKFLDREAWLFVMGWSRLTSLADNLVNAQQGFWKRSVWGYVVTINYEVREIEREGEIPLSRSRGRYWRWTRSWRDCRCKVKRGL